ncbi:hypothetical protein LTS18_005043 [Coniosporium uncinatum]|uniref:Uncharacterized protein n=1 Tax=Coniosporium uncinatum TaxID=93489 RepID=A0ACC3D5E2_9PEZI|nr:hypothetical protein LTS18_005043 [Coniosporium uncinatum]
MPQTTRLTSDLNRAQNPRIALFAAPAPSITASFGQAQAERPQLVKKLPPAEKQQGKELYQQWRGKLTELRGVLDIFELDQLPAEQSTIDGGESRAIKFETETQDEVKGNAWLKSEPDDNVNMLHNIPSFGGGVKFEFTPDPARQALRLEPGYEPPPKRRKTSYHGFGS